MSLYYVPLVLVIEGDDPGHAEGAAEECLGALVALKPKNIDGYTLLNFADTSLASSEWINKDQCITIGLNKRVSIGEYDIEG